MKRRLSSEQLFKIGPTGLEPLTNEELIAAIDAQPEVPFEREPFKHELDASEAFELLRSTLKCRMKNNG